MTGGALVIGEALIDEVVEPGRVSRHPGGSPANVALGLARLGVPTRLHTAIGNDDDGNLIRTHLGASGVTFTPESTTGAPTSKAIATLAPDGSATYEFAVGWEPRDLGDLGAPVIVHTGSLGAFLEPGARITADILRRGRVAGALVSFDPNVRPSIVTDLITARETFLELAASSHITKLSDEDAEYLFPGVSSDSVIDLILETGVAVVGITRGSKGAYLASGRERVTIPPVETVVVDTVGAGDTFMATLIWTLIVGDSAWDGTPVSGARLADIGSTSAQAAAITVSRAGADLPTLADLWEKTDGER